MHNDDEHFRDDINLNGLWPCAHACLCVACESSSTIPHHWRYILRTIFSSISISEHEAVCKICLRSSACIHSFLWGSLFSLEKLALLCKSDQPDSGFVSSAAVKQTVSWVFALHRVGVKGNSWTILDYLVVFCICKLPLQILRIIILMVIVIVMSQMRLKMNLNNFLCCVHFKNWTWLELGQRDYWCRNERV